MDMFTLLKQIYPLRLAPVSRDTDRATEVLRGELPFVVHEYASGREHNGWIVPNDWRAVRAEIRKGGQLIHDGMRHPLGVVGYSTSFSGKLTLEELQEHLFFHKTIPDALVYHPFYYYKPWERDWGMSLPHNQFLALDEGEYEVVLETEDRPGTMKVLDYLLEGETSDCIVFNAHNCHAGQANDGTSGVVVAVELMKRLAQRPRRRYSYRAIIAPEHFGTIFYLADCPDDIVASFKGTVFLEMLGLDQRFGLQDSFEGNTSLDRAAHHHLKHCYPDHISAGFRRLVGNDEVVWESPGYEIPCISLSRAWYPEYHSSMDDEAIVSADRLEEAVEAVLGIVDILERDMRMQRQFKGLVALSNPKYDLYISPGTPCMKSEVPASAREWNHLMNCIVRHFDGESSILDVAEKYDIEFALVRDYVEKFEQRGLIRFL